MKDEIKEILDRLFVYRNENDEMKYQPEDILTIEDVWLLLDYITNLQEEVEYKELWRKEYLERIDKAIDKLYCYGEVFEREILKQFQKEMLNILNGDDEE